MATATRPKKTEVDPYTLTVDNLGPIEHGEFPGKPGTVVVLTGPNGVGKSTVLDVVDTIATGRSARLTSRDGTTGGSATGFGVTLKLSRNGATRRMNDLVVEAVEDEIGVAQLVDPGLKDEAAADMRRIKALCVLVGATVTPEQLYELVGSREDFEAIVKPESLQHADPLAVVDAVKRDLEAAARAAHSQAEQAYGASVAKLAENDGIDLDAPCDEHALNQELERAIKDQSRLKEQLRQQQQDAVRRAEALRKIDELKAQMTGPTIEAAAYEVTQRGLDVSEWESRVADYRRLLDEAVARVDTHRAQLKAAQSVLSLVRQQNEMLLEWQKTLEQLPEDAEDLTAQIFEAEQEVANARQAVLTGQRVRDALNRKADAERRSQEAAQARQREERLREAAKGTLDVLAESVRRVSNRVKFDSNFRLVVDHPARGECYFSDLSHGERWSLCLDMVMESARQRGKPAVLGIPQEAWEGLDGRNRQMLIDKVHNSQLIVFTAEADRAQQPGEGLTAQVL